MFFVAVTFGNPTGVKEMTNMKYVNSVKVVKKKGHIEVGVLYCSGQISL